MVGHSLFLSYPKKNVTDRPCKSNINTAFKEHFSSEKYLDILVLLLIYKD